MSRNAEHWFERWSRTREQGVWRFVVVRGLLAFGLPFAALTSLLDFYLDDRTFHVGLFAMRAVVGGLTFGALGWRLNERRFRKHQRTNA
jgi:hypothetical protein